MQLKKAGKGLILNRENQGTLLTDDESNDNSTTGSELHHQSGSDSIATVRAIETRAVRERERERERES